MLEAHEPVNMYWMPRVSRMRATRPTNSDCDIARDAPGRAGGVPLRTCRETSFAGLVETETSPSPSTRSPSRSAVAASWRGEFRDIDGDSVAASGPSLTPAGILVRLPLKYLNTIL